MFHDRTLDEVSLGALEDKEIIAELIANCKERNLQKIACPQVLRLLAMNDDPNVRADVAINPHTPDMLLESLADDGNPTVLHNVAYNPNTPSETLAFLAKNSGQKYVRVREAVAQNPSASPETLHTLANDVDYETRLNVARNPSTTSETLDLMGKVEVDPSVHQEARRALWARQDVAPAHSYSEEAATAIRHLWDTLEDELDEKNVSSNLNRAIQVACAKLTEIAKVADSVTNARNESAEQSSGLKI